MIATHKINEVFQKSIEHYHIKDDVDQPTPQVEMGSEFENLLFKKNWIDTVQWHLEDIIRDPEIEPARALEIKRWIDHSNQNRTDMVEQIDEFLHEHYKDNAKGGARINTETPGWAIDRLSILNLKIYHFSIEAERSNISQQLQAKNKQKLNVLNQQISLLTQAIDALLADLQSGNAQSWTFMQMKMYNDEDLNPVLRRLQK